MMAQLIIFACLVLSAVGKVLMVATTSLLAYLSATVLVQIYQANRAYIEFKRKSNGITMIPNRNMICNHALLALTKNCLQNLMKDHKRTGEKTLGWLHHTQFGVSTLDADLMKRIVLDTNKNTNRLKVDGPAVEFNEDTLMLAENEQWRRLRRAVAPALRANKFKAPNVVSEIENSIEKLLGAIENKLAKSNDNQKLQGVTVEAEDLLHRFTLDVVFRCFYKQCDLIDYNAPNCRWTKIVDEGLEGATGLTFKLGMMIKALCGPIDWLILNFHQQGKWRAELIQFIKRQTQLSLKARMELEELKAEGKQVDEDSFKMRDGTHFKRNMADHIADHLLDGKITQREYVNTSSFLITAGDKTILDSMVYTLYQLGLDRGGVQQKLRESIKEEGPDSVYLDWVVSESLRLMPPASIACSRIVVDEMRLDDGKVLPAGTFVSYSGYIVHRLEEYWGPEAEEFKPERWRDTSHHHPLQYVPFGAGARQCPGREFALFEMKELLSRLLLRYEFHSEPKADIDQFYAPFSAYVVCDLPTFIKITRV